MSLDTDERAFITFAITGPNGQSSEIQIPANDINILPFLQKVQDSNDEGKNREPLTRRPSYRKIYNELSLNTSVCATSPTGSLASPSNLGLNMSNCQLPMSLSLESPLSLKHSTSPPMSSQSPIMSPNKLASQTKTVPILQLSHGQPQSSTTNTLGLNYSNVLPTNHLQLSPGSPNIQTVLGNASLFQYAQTPDGNTVLIPVSLGSSVRQQCDSVQNFSVTTASSAINTVSISDNNSPGILNAIDPGSSDDCSSKKREVRLLKNREAARECRRKKKEYVRCLENRVSLLEAQNTKLIQELQKFKTLCSKDVRAMLLGSSPLNTNSSSQQVTSSSIEDDSLSNLDNKSLSFPLSVFNTIPLKSDAQCGTGDGNSDIS